MMKFMKRIVSWLMTAILTLTCLNVPVAMAEDESVVTVTVNVTNTPIRGDVALEKTGLLLTGFAEEKDEHDNTVMKPVYENGYLSGAVFELRAAENIIGKEGTIFYEQDELVETLTSSASGTVRSQLLPLGAYYLQEVSAPNGYVFDDATYPVTIAAVDKQTAVVEVKVSASNTYLPIRITLNKQKETLRSDITTNGMIHQSIEIVPGEGFVFGLYNA